MAQDSVIVERLAGLLAAISKPAWVTPAELFAVTAAPAASVTSSTSPFQLLRDLEPRLCELLPRAATVCAAAPIPPS